MENLLMFAAPNLLAAASSKPFSDPTVMEFGWPDIVMVLVIVAGFFYGRKRGMSSELLDLIQWIMIVIVCGYFYEQLGVLIKQTTNLSVLLSNVLAYLSITLMLKLVFSAIRYYAGEKLVGANVFGVLEYYLGMLAGMIHFFCVLIWALSLINARQFTPQELAEDKKYQREAYGDISFPTYGTFQETVFKQSFTGPLIKETFNWVMIKPTVAGTTKTDSLKIRRERDVYDAMGR